MTDRDTLINQASKQRVATCFSQSLIQLINIKDTICRLLKLMGMKKNVTKV